MQTIPITIRFGPGSIYRVHRSTILRTHVEDWLNKSHRISTILDTYSCSGCGNGLFFVRADNTTGHEWWAGAAAICDNASRAQRRESSKIPILFNFAECTTRRVVVVVVTTFVVADYVKEITLSFGGFVYLVRHIWWIRFWMSPQASNTSDTDTVSETRWLNRSIIFGEQLFCILVFGSFREMDELKISRWLYLLY